MSTNIRSSHFLKSQGLWLMDVAATFPFVIPQAAAVLSTYPRDTVTDTCAQ